MATKELVLNSGMLKPGDQVSWTRWATYDHHALVITVLGPNEIEVFEFTTRSGDKTDGKTYKKRTRLPIFYGSDPVYKVFFVFGIRREDLDFTRNLNFTNTCFLRIS